MLGSRELVGFVPTRQPDKARAFYETVLGLKCLEENPFVVVIRTKGARVLLQKVERLVPARYTILGWEVKDIRRTAAFLKKRGVVFQKYAGMKQDALGVWTSPDGGKVAWFKDPDGNTLSISQH